ncbi:trans-aconitate 2-methyltransferase [Motilibacter peucedani]|uniref:Trans-aconitate 2-methyltransferase n=1 Tax=Motilibacter peucedani TaxID=598650 RepID=A0A420XNI5_9ACTN|nr:class I SAM-dependent methyltransferase [Motilibacter peucedani]RKS73746.1 trans-aconitate 2-methyltransferase [Motilibacter peucedani]
MELVEWDARVYDSLPLPHEHWGRAVVERLALTGDETVLDIGCGSGRDAGLLLERLPRGQVVAVDGSVHMLEQLRATIGDDPRVTAVQSDLRQPFTLDEPADAAISVATLHWVPDIDVVFRSLAACLRPGGRFVAECGGRGNIAAFQHALAEVTGSSDSDMWEFRDVDQTRDSLLTAGFVDVEVRLVEDPARLERGEQLDTFVATVLLAAHLHDLPPAERRPFVQAVTARMPEPVVDYVRLQLEATRA